MGEMGHVLEPWSADSSMEPPDLSSVERRNYTTALASEWGNLFRPALALGPPAVHGNDGASILPAGTYRYRMTLLTRRRSLAATCTIWSNPFVLEKDTPLGLPCVGGPK